MNRKTVILPACIGGILFVTGLFAAGVPDIIPMESRAYEKHTKTVVRFAHKKHMTDYARANPDLYKNGCGECHHDKTGSPLTALKEGDTADKCIECHKTPGPPKTETSPLTDREKLAFHAYALHQNCTGCHKTFTKTTGKKTAPTVCAKCHVTEGEN